MIKIQIHWADGRKLVLPPDWTLEQAMSLLAQLDDLEQARR